MKRRLRCLSALLITAMTLLLFPHVLSAPTQRQLPGKTGGNRTLLRIWITSAVGGGESWLRQQVKRFERANPGVQTYIRTVSPDECLRDDAVLPDLVLYLPGDFTAPEAVFAPLSGVTGTQEALLRAGRWQGRQYGLPLCYAAYALAIDGALEPGSAATPAPTTLLGTPDATDPPGHEQPRGYPLEAASAANIALQAPDGCGLFTLAELLPPGARPPLPESFGTLSAAQVFADFKARRCATALLTTGQLTALTAQTAAGNGFPFRVIAPEDIITDQVWFGSVFPEADENAAALLSWLITSDAQRDLRDQGLYPVRDDLRLYAAGHEASVERSAARSLVAVNAYLPRADVASLARQTFQGTISLQEALPPLL